MPSCTLLTADDGLIDGVQVGPVSILAVDGVIASVGKSAIVERDPRAKTAQRLDFPGKAVVPGTVNAHNHSFQSLLRGIGDDLPFLVWRDKALYRYSPMLDARAMETAGLFAFGEMLLHGVTTVCDFYYVNRQGNDNARATIGAAQRLGMRMVMARCFYDWDGAPASYRETIPQATQHFKELHSEFHDAHRRMVSVQPAPHSQHGATPEMIQAGAAAAAEAGTPWHIHLAEEAYQVDESLKRFGKRPLWAVDQLGVLSDKTIVVHGCWFDAEERALLAERGASLAYNPASNMFLGDGITDVVDLRKRGVRVGLGTDGGCSNNRVSVFDEMRMAALLQKVSKTDGQAISADDCFRMGTELGGQILDLPVGKLALGYRLDAVLVDLHDPSLWPTQALAKNVVYALSSRAVSDVVVDGKLVVKDKKLVNVELEEISARVRELTGSWQRQEA